MNRFSNPDSSVDVYITLRLKDVLLKDRSKFVEELIASFLFNKRKATAKQIMEFVTHIIKISHSKIHKILETSDKILKRPDGEYELKNDYLILYKSRYAEFTKLIERNFKKFFKDACENIEKFQKAFVTSYSRFLEKSKFGTFTEMQKDYSTIFNNLFEFVSIPPGCNGDKFKEGFWEFLLANDEYVKKLQGILIQNHIYIHAYNNPKMRKLIGTVLDDAEIFLDTPILYSYVIEQDPQHESASLIIENSKKRKIPIKVFEHTDAEFKEVLRNKLSRAVEIIRNGEYFNIDEIEESSLGLESIVEWVRRKNTGGELNFANLYEQLINKYEELNLEIEKSDATDIPDRLIERLKEELKKRYREIHKNKTGREKGDISAEYDVKSLKLLQQLKKEGRKVFFVTPDLSLPKFLHDVEEYEDCFVLSLDSMVVVFMQYEEREDVVYDVLYELVSSKLVTFRILTLDRLEQVKEVLKGYHTLDPKIVRQILSELEVKIKENPYILSEDTDDFREMVHSLIERTFKKRIENFQEENRLLKQQIDIMTKENKKLKEKVDEIPSQIGKEWFNRYVLNLKLTSKRDLEKIRQKFQQLRAPDLKHNIPYRKYMLKKVVFTIFLNVIAISLLFLIISALKRNWSPLKSFFISSGLPIGLDLLLYFFRKEWKLLHFKKSFIAHIEKLESNEKESLRTKVEDELVDKANLFGISLTKHEREKIIREIFEDHTQS